MFVPDYLSKAVDRSVYDHFFHGKGYFKERRNWAWEKKIGLLQLENLIFDTFINDHFDQCLNLHCLPFLQSPCR